MWKAHGSGVPGEWPCDQCAPRSRAAPRDRGGETFDSNRNTIRNRMRQLYTLIAYGIVIVAALCDAPHAKPTLRDSRVTRSRSRRSRYQIDRIPNPIRESGIEADEGQRRALHRGRENLVRIVSCSSNYVATRIGLCVTCGRIPRYELLLNGNTRILRPILDWYTEYNV